MNRAPEQIEPPEDAAYLPLRYYVELLEILAADRDRFEILTYDDLPWGDDWDYRGNYPEELRNWRAQLRDGRRDPSKIYVILQHDVDTRPERTLNVLRHEARLGLRSNVMIFHRRVSRRHQQRTGELLYTDYEVEPAYLRTLQDEHGFVIAYHCNALERAMFDEAEALRTFESDVEALRAQGFHVRYFSPHGGVRSPDGKTSNSLPIPASLERSLRWVANTQTVRLDGSYSDGGINSLSRDPDKRDLRDFVKAWQPGKRYRILTHPQYYAEETHVSPRLIEARWYRELLEAARDPSKPLWINPSASGRDGGAVGAAAPRSDDATAPVEPPDSSKRRGHFPIEYFAGFLRFLAARPDLFEVITYADLAWPDDLSSPSIYKQEWDAWRKRARDPRKIYVLIQHDIDTYPRRAVAQWELEAELGVPSNIMIFNRRIDRGALKHGDLRETAYDIDLELLQRLEREGRFVVGYHSNALEQASFDAAEAQRVFERDVAALRGRFAMRFYSAHGGVRGPKGEVNADLPTPPPLASSIVRVQNGGSPIFDAQYSDGGLSNAQDIADLDLRRFVERWRPGGRYRVLTHPQYYHTPCRLPDRDVPWLREVIELCESGRAEEVWRGVEIASRPPTLRDRAASVVRRLRG